jgi:hypothetical protein
MTAVVLALGAALGYLAASGYLNPYSLAPEKGVTIEVIVSVCHLFETT